MLNKTIEIKNCTYQYDIEFYKLVVEIKSDE